MARQQLHLERILRVDHLDNQLTARVSAPPPPFRSHTHSDATAIRRPLGSNRALLTGKLQRVTRDANSFEPALCNATSPDSFDEQMKSFCAPHQLPHPEVRERRTVTDRQVMGSSQYSISLGSNGASVLLTSASKTRM